MSAPRPRLVIVDGVPMSALVAEAVASLRNTPTLAVVVLLVTCTLVLAPAASK